MAFALLSSWSASLPLVAAVSRPLRRVANRMHGRARAAGCPEAAAPAAACVVVPLRPVPMAAAPPPAGLCAAPARPLRVIMRQHDDGACRLVISGRMADVCAELDRLVLN